MAKGDQRGCHLDVTSQSRCITHKVRFDTRVSHSSNHDGTEDKKPDYRHYDADLGEEDQELLPVLERELPCLPSDVLAVS